MRRAFAVMASGMEVTKAMEKLFKPGRGPAGRVAEALGDMMSIASMLPVNKEDDAAFFSFLEFLMLKISSVQPGGVMIAPAGWCTRSYVPARPLFLFRASKSSFSAPAAPRPRAVVSGSRNTPPIEMRLGRPAEGAEKGSSAKRD